MRYLPSVDLDGMIFSSWCLEATLCLWASDRARATAFLEDIRASVLHLPIDHPDLESVKAYLNKVRDKNWSAEAKPDEILELRAQLSQFMRLRQPEPQYILEVDIDDAFQEQQWIVVGPAAKEFEVETYRKEVEGKVRALAENDVAMQKIAHGAPITPKDLQHVERLLNKPELYVTEETLRTAYDAPQGSLVALLRHALGIEHLPRRKDAIRAAFEAFVANHGYMEADKIRFVRLFAERLISLGKVGPGDLYDKPFSVLGPPDRLLPEKDLEELLWIAARFEKVA